MRPPVAALALFALLPCVPAGRVHTPGTPGTPTSPAVVPNDNLHPAGMRRGDTVTVRLSLGRAEWAPDGAAAQHVVVEAFAEDGKAPSIPAPLLRVRTGTVLAVSVRNALSDSTIYVFGLWSHPGHGKDTVAIAPGETRTVRFATGAAGTYLYGARTGRHVDGFGKPERETAIGAFVVDPPGPVPADRILVMNIWGDPIDSLNYSNALAINGMSWPFTERMQATSGDTVRWRVVNGTARGHPMHLHGFFFTVTASGTALADTARRRSRRHEVVTEQMQAYETIAMEWTPSRPGNWLFHCHIAYHVIPEAAQLTPADSMHDMTHSPDVTKHMKGLILGITVQPRAGEAAESRARVRTLHLDVREDAPKPNGVRRMRYMLGAGGADAATAWRSGGPMLVLQRGEPTDVVVANHLREATSVHWHGLELESFSDGIVGWSGSGTHVAPPIETGGSFVAHLSVPRAGTFMYHTHLGDLTQLTAGLYGALIVVPPDQPFDPAVDHVFLAGQDGPNDGTDAVVNGEATASQPLILRAGTTHRLRLINIAPAAGLRWELTRNSVVVPWRPLAKDGADFANALQRDEPAVTSVRVGETRDFLFTPPAPGEYVLHATAAKALPGWRQTLIVRP